ncbi:hypothetical protein [Endozoicomonas arenosclerae]|uniref:hypothetical protein n=1 Tax=Endozoicomonas arenosclerae TaxID=1633495 RepID=UPI0007818CE6|nr:hypothetical protein [Endozoicomonas arenosclerae]
MTRAVQLFVLILFTAQCIVSQAKPSITKVLPATHSEPSYNNADDKWPGEAQSCIYYLKLQPYWSKIALNLESSPLQLYRIMHFTLSATAIEQILMLWLNGDISDQPADSWEPLIDAAFTIPDLSTYEALIEAKPHLLDMTETPSGENISHLEVNQITLRFTEILRPFWREVAEALGVSKAQIRDIEVFYNYHHRHPLDEFLYQQTHQASAKQTISDHKILRAGWLEPDIRKHIINASMKEDFLDVCPDLGRISPQRRTASKRIQPGELPKFQQLNHLILGNKDYRLLEIIQPYWKQLAYLIGAEDWHIRSIVMDYSHSEFEQTLMLMLLWSLDKFSVSHKETAPFTWEALIKATDSIPELTSDETYMNFRNELEF